MRAPNITAGLVFAAVTAIAGSALAEDAEPEFEHKDPEELDEVDGIEWSARAQGSLVHNSGNSQNTTISAGADASRRAGRNRLKLEASAAYARAAVLAGEDRSETGVLDDDSEIVRRDETTSQAWSANARYDRFVTRRASIYSAALARADRPAGIALTGGGQVGYGREIYRGENHELTAEMGYDFSYERFVSQSDGVANHSARLFLGYVGKFSEDTEGKLTGEALTNLNPLSKPTGDVGAFGDTRLRGAASVTTELLDGISFQGSFSARYRTSPAPLPPLDIPYAEGFVPEAQRLDTTTELTLIVSFL